MYAIFEDGSRQYRVEPGSTVVIDYRDVDPAATLELTKVLLYQNGSETVIGRPLVEGAKVIVEVVDDFVAVKTITQKFRRRKASKRLKGHTQPHIRVKVKHILKAGETIPVTDSTPAPAPAAS
ncbi:MAG TPA: 50S ribosomal protein L21 [Gemmata sp.]|jgi:large subunit ribosomal protein L21|nr:50S ribosomal protein L21 [Gemmata sp.]